VFASVKELPEELVKRFIAETHRVTNRCDFKNIKDRPIQDHLMVGMNASR